MNSELCKSLGIDFPLFAFSHCKDVVAAVSKAGGMGVLGAVNLTPEQLESELNWIDKNINGKPYGVDLIVPNKFDGKGKDLSKQDLLSRVPNEHKVFADKILEDYGIQTDDLEEDRINHLVFQENLTIQGAQASLDVAFSHPIKLIANALGIPPKIMINMGRERGVQVAALVGKPDHAVAQIDAGIDILVVAGGEAGGHCGDIATMVLVPEVCNIVKKMGANTHVLAAGGIATGSQMAAVMAMGAAGAWCGSVWLTTTDSEVSPVVREKMLKASSKDTVRSRSRTGKPSRQLRSRWTDLWDSKEAPEALPMPLQTLVSEPALGKVDKMTNHEGAQALSTYWVGQAVGLMNEEKSAGSVVQDFKEDFLEAYERLQLAIES